MEPILELIDDIGWSVILTFVLLLLAIYYSYSTRGYDYWKKQGVPGPSSWPLFGTSKPNQIFKKVDDRHKQDHKKYGKVFGGFEGRVPVLYVTDLDLIKQIMVKDFPSFTDRRTDQRVPKDPVFSKVLPLLHGDEWKATRSLLTPTFTSGKLKQMFYLIEDCVKMLLESLDKSAESKQPIEVRHCFSAFTLDVIASCAFGMTTNSLENQDNEFVTNARSAFTSPAIINYIRTTFPALLALLQKPMAYFKGDPFGFFKRVANEMIDLRLADKLQPRKDFLDLLIEAQKEEENNEQSSNGEPNSSAKSKKILTRNGMVANCIIFLLAGHETTATTLSFWAYCLATNPHVQDKLINEIDDVMTECKGKLTYEIVMGLKYLDMAVSEALRLYPPAVRIERTCGIDGYRLGDIVLKKDSVIVTSIATIHHDEKIYPNPQTYDPERFTPENIAKRNSYAYMPFGLGPRNCIAKRFALTELKLTMAYILSQFRFVTCDKTEFPLQFNPTVSLLSPKSITLQMQKRVDCPHFDN